MRVATFEGVVENGQIRRRANIRLPDNARVYVVVPDIQTEQVAQIASPRLVLDGPRLSWEERRHE